MEKDNFVNIFVAQCLYEKEFAEKLGFDLNSDYGRKKLNEYLEQERQFDVLNAISNLKKMNPGKFIRRSEIIIEVDKIKNKRLEPYIEKLKVIDKNQIQQEEKQDRSEPVKKLTPPKR